MALLFVSSLPLHTSLRSLTNININNNRYTHSRLHRQHGLSHHNSISNNLEAATCTTTVKEKSNFMGNLTYEASKKKKRSASSTTNTTTASIKSIDRYETLDISSQLDPHYHQQFFSSSGTSATTTHRRRRERSAVSISKKNYLSLFSTPSTKSTPTLSPTPSPTTTSKPSDLVDIKHDNIDDVRKRRKPHGYWNQLENIERELLLVNSQLGYTGRKIIPRIPEMKQLGRGDLIAALMKHGGITKVAATLRWGRPPKSKPSVVLESSATSTNINNTISEANSCSAVSTNVKSNNVVTKSFIRQKLPRRPKSYWKEVERVHCEMSAFMEEFGSRGIMPTRKQLYEYGRSDLANAAMKHGGLRIIAKQMGIKGRKECKPRGYWTDFNAIRDAIVEFARVRNHPTVMPTADELFSGGQSCLVNAIASHGGFPVVAKKCGLKARNFHKQGAPVLWNEARLRREYLSFLMTFHPDLAEQKIMVGERQLRKHGRNDLCYAIQKLGGYTVLQSKLGLKKRTFSKP